MARPARSPDTGLAEYRRKRRFSITPEPAGRRRALRARRPLSFVVQKHAASVLHYDFRLEWDGVLLSWAVPKGPSLDPHVKRLARAVEDHPRDYRHFEGTIPAGEYGGGTVMIWDEGTWTPLGDDPDAALRAGKLEFELQGSKLQGRFVLVRMHGRDARNWLLFKGRDRYAATTDVTRSRPRSVRTDRNLDEIAAGKRTRSRAKRAS